MCKYYVQEKLTSQFPIFLVEGVVMNVYDPHNVGEKRDFIKSLRKLQDRINNDHWVVGGNFNLITSLEEKKGGQRKLEDE